MELKIEDVLIQVKSKLNDDRIKLWTSPYFETGVGTIDTELKRLAENYSSELGLNFDHCSAALHELQSHALEKLKERERFNETGVATLKVRIPNQTGGTLLSTIKIKLTAPGTELKEAVAKEISSAAPRIKLICQGKVLKDDEPLGNQNIKNGMQIMAVVLYGDPDEVEKEGKRREFIEATRADLKLLAKSRNANDMLYMQVEDQAGNTLNLPPKERKALVTAMAFHEKGRVALKQDDHTLALVFLLEADEEFSQCNSEILKSVDNYALLNLDIAWCYLCLKSVSQIPDAEERLKKCEENFHRSYGPNLERLIALKGTTGNEASLFMRLHLLQGIIMFHLNRRNDAKLLLERAEKELATLKVDDTSLCTLIELGFSPPEARLGLRATQGNVNAAAEYITRNREERAERRKKAKAEEKMNRERRKLGKCADGKQWVEPNLLQLLVGMGFSNEVARMALQQTNNIVSESVQLIQEHPELFDAAIASTSEVKITKSLIDQVVVMGFDPRMAKVALKKHKGNVEFAVEELAACGGIIEGEHLTDDEQDEISKVNAALNIQQEQIKQHEAFSRVSEGISMVDDDHLDLTLVQEEAFLTQYKKLLQEL